MKEVKKKSLKAVILSDTHGYHEEIEVPEGDLLIHCGDCLKGGLHTPLDSVIAFNQWLGTLPHPHKILIAGNLDIPFETHSLKARSLITHAIYLEDEAIEIEGWKIYGSPYTPRFGPWAFQKPAGPRMKEVWDRIPEDTDILITHGPPKGILDRTFLGIHAGCERLAQKIERIHVKYHFFGHIHEARGSLQKGETLFVNAALYPPSFKKTKEPLSPFSIVLTP
ncbi:MAG: metallophosphoesterase [Planctomycetota bacterium]|nr:MAG: metallophosphoesterase [Planctomycetota bacterium]